MILTIYEVVRTIDFVKKERKAGRGALGLVSAVACCAKSRMCLKKKRRRKLRVICARILVGGRFMGWGEFCCAHPDSHTNLPAPYPRRLSSTCVTRILSLWPTTSAALVLLAYRRIVSRHRIRHCATVRWPLAAVAQTRPFEWPSWRPEFFGLRRVHHRHQPWHWHQQRFCPCA